MKRQENYLKNLIHYLDQFQKYFDSNRVLLKECVSYLEQVLKTDSATDTTCLMRLKKLMDSFEYCEKYLDISKEFYRDKQKE